MIGKKIRILLLEDQDMDAELILRQLRQEGFDFTAERVFTEQDYLAQLRNFLPDIILADYSLPGYDGFSALALTQRERPETPFIFVSGTLGEEVAIEALHRGATDYVLKTRLSRLGPAVRRAMSEQAERELRRQVEEQVRDQAALLDLVQEAIAVRNLKGRVTYWNRGAAQLYGWTAQEIMAQTAEELVRFFQTPEAEQQAVAKGSWSGELRKAAKNGREVQVRSRWIVMRDPAGNPQSFLVVDSDLTDQKKVEAELLRVQRLESIGRLAGGIAHDLNNVLAPIMMAVQLLQDEVQDESLQSVLATLASSTQRGANIVKQVLAFARGIGSDKTPIMPGHLIKEMVAMMRETFPKSITVRVNLADSLWLISGDMTQLHQVLMNLCVNARDAMPKGGTLTLTVENTTLDQSYVSMVPEAKAGPYVLLQVIDTGEGIPPEYLDKIFDPFFTTKPPDKGTGLGLSTALGIVKSHGGFLRVESRVGVGSRFKIYCPALSSGTAAPAEVTAPRPPQGQGELVLVVDDEDSVREIIAMILGDHGYRVLAARDGAEGLALYAQNMGDIKLVVTDLVMPVMDGTVATRAVQKMDPLVKILIMSGKGEESEATNISDLSVQAFLQKPFTAPQLLQGVYAALHSQPV
jgi:two-component system cell cycle sensor histidine kinase/response regulator CckA